MEFVDKGGAYALLCSPVSSLFLSLTEVRGRVPHSQLPTMWEKGLAWQMKSHPLISPSHRTWRSLTCSSLTSCAPWRTLCSLALRCCCRTCKRSWTLPLAPFSTSPSSNKVGYRWTPWRSCTHKHIQSPNHQHFGSFFWLRLLTTALF